MSKKKLKNSPLQEVIFELKWDLPLDEQGNPYDPGYDKAFGLFAQELEPRFPVQKPLLPPNSPIIPIGFPLHQFWQQELLWPVIQIGRGILTVNDIESNYIWEDNYRQIVEIAVEAFIKSYHQSVTISSLGLQYIDAIDVADEVTSASKYIASNFQTEVINRHPIPGKEAGISLSQLFELEDKSLLISQIQTSLNNRNGKRAIVWSTEVRKNGFTQSSEVLNWLDYAHKKCSEHFTNQLDRSFYESLDQ